MGTRTLSYSWSQVRGLRMRVTTLVLTPLQGRKQRWRISVRGDRRLLRLLAPHVTGQPRHAEGGLPRPVPLWHCPECLATHETRPEECGACNVRFRSPRSPPWPHLPSRGVVCCYTGHFVLGTLDLVGEVLIAAIVALTLLFASSRSEIVGGVAMGAFLLALTKLESAHLSQIFSRFTTPEPADRRRAWSRASVAGSLSRLRSSRRR